MTIDKCKIIVSVICISLIWGCQSNDKKSDEPATPIKTISIDTKSVVETEMSKVFENVKYIRLDTDTNNLIGNIRKVKKIGDTFFIQTNKSIFKYSTDGKLKSFLSHIGEGQGEFRSITDFSVDSTTMGIEVLDHKSQKIVTYDNNNQYVDEWKINLIARSFEKLNNDTYAFTCSTVQPSEDLFYSLIVKSKQSDKILQKALAFSPKNAEFRNFMDGKNFSHTSSGVTFSISGTDTLFSLSPTDFSPKYYINFEKKTVPESIKLSKYQDVSVYSQALSRNGGYAGIYNAFIYETAKRLITFPSIHVNEKGDFMKAFMILNKETGKNILMNSLKDDVVFIGQKNKISEDFMPVGASDNELYSVLEAAKAIEKIEIMRSQVSKKEWEDLLSQNTSLKNLSSSLTLGDNPILVINTLLK